MTRHVIAALVGLAAVLLWSSTSRAAPPLADYGKLPAVESMRLSPTGDKLAYFAVAGDTRQVIIRQVGGPVLLTIGTGELKPRMLEWADDGHVVILTSRTLGITDNGTVYLLPFEMLQATIINVATGKLINAFHGAQKMLRATFGYYGHAQVGGKPVAYFGGLALSGSGQSFQDFDSGAAYITHMHVDLYQVDLDSGYAQKVGGGSERIDTRWVLGPGGAIVAHDEYDQATGGWRLFADPEDAALLAQAVSPTREVTLVGLGRAPGTVLVEQPTAAEGGDWRYLEYDVGKAGVRGLAPAAGVMPFGDMGMRRLIYDAATGRLLGGVGADAERKTILFDPAQQAGFDAVRRLFHEEQAELVTASSDFKRLVVRTVGAGDSGTYFLIDLVTRKAEAVAWDYPTILLTDVAETRTVAYKAADGLDIEAVLTLPPGRTPQHLPLVVMPHGGPEAHDDAGFDYWAQAFASRGYAVLQSNFRGSSGYGRAFRDAGFGEWGRKMQTDLSDGVAELVRQGLVDPRRVCIVGASYGGYAALAGVTVQHGLYRCAVSYGAVSDPGVMLRNERQKYGEQNALVRYRRLFLGDADAEAIAPLRLAARADAAILIAYGKDDTVVDTSQSTLMVDALKRAGKPVEVLAAPDEDHWLSRQAGRSQVVAASVEFVVRNNPPD